MKCFLKNSCGYFCIIIVGSGFGCSNAARKARLEYGISSAAQRFHSIKRGAAGALAAEHQQMLSGVELHESAERKENSQLITHVAKKVEEPESTKDDAAPESQDADEPKKKWKFGKKIGRLIKKNERLTRGWEITKAVVNHATEPLKEAVGLETKEERQARKIAEYEREREHQRQLYKLDQEIRKQIADQAANAEAGSPIVWTPPPTAPTPTPTGRRPSEKKAKELAKAREEEEKQRQEMIAKIMKEIAEEAQQKRELEEKGRERAAERSKKKAEKMKTCKPCGATDIDDRLRTLLCRAEVLDYNLPSDTNRVRNACTSVAMQKTMLNHAMSVRPIVHPRVKKLASNFLAYKRQNGSSNEKQLYLNMTIGDFLQRLFVKRPVAFFGPSDTYMLRDGTRGTGGFSDIGTDKQHWPLLIEDYLSYEEMEISALLGVSVPTLFINSGSRGNNCYRAKEGSFESEGIYVGLVGARFEVIGKMEWKYMIVSKDQNVDEDGYGKHGAASHPMISHWAELYGLSYLPTYEDALAQWKKYGSKRFLPGNSKKFKKEDFFDAKIYQARCEITAEMFLAEANERAKANGAIAYCQTVGLGLGVWGMHHDQGHIQIESYIAAIKRLSLPHVGAIVFRGSRSKKSMTSTSVKDKDGAPIMIVRSNRDPAAKLPESKPGAKPWLLVSQYAWDGNSYPGNEYWLGNRYFKMSGDPAAACSSYISELQNPEVNVEAFDSNNIQVVPVESRTQHSSKGLRHSSVFRQ